MRGVPQHTHARRARGTPDFGRREEPRALVEGREHAFASKADEKLRRRTLPRSLRVAREAAAIARDQTTRANAACLHWHARILDEGVAARLAADWPSTIVDTADCSDLSGARTSALSGATRGRARRSMDVRAPICGIASGRRTRPTIIIRGARCCERATRHRRSMTSAARGAIAAARAVREQRLHGWFGRSRTVRRFYEVCNHIRSQEYRGMRDAVSL